MCKVYIFALYVGPFPPYNDGLFVGLAITEKGKWCAGSCSQTGGAALDYLDRMKPRIAERVGKPIHEVELVRELRPELIAKAFETMP